MDSQPSNTNSEPATCAGCNRPLLADGNCPEAGNCAIGARLKSILEGSRRNRREYAVAKMAERAELPAARRMPVEKPKRATVRERVNANRRVLPPGDRE